MKKLIFIILISLTVMSCSNSITVQNIETGRVDRIRETHGVIKVGDTIVLITSNKSYGYSFYGKYVGKIPAPIIDKKGGTSVYYVAVKRIK
tara:strand:+ start:7098 stop:7370 length:273 start_codon:yes stop_codon:yes gene_type:complete